MKVLFDENNLTAIITQLSDGRYSAYIPEIDGMSAEGDTEAEAEENLMEKLKVIKLMNSDVAVRKVRR